MTKRIPKHPDNVVNRYKRRLNSEITSRWKLSIDENVVDTLPVMLKDGSLNRTKYKEAVLAVKNDMRLSSKAVSSMSKEAALKTSKFNKTVVRQLTYKDFAKDIPNINDVVETFVDYNVRLIKGLSEDVIQKLTKRITTGVKKGYSVEEIQTSIRYGIVNDKSIYKTIKARMNLIATDQIGKLNGDLTKLRCKLLGFDKYIWRTRQDERVRPEHAEREGQIFYWNNPPDGGHPGEDFNCRCWAEPVKTKEDEENEE